MKKFVFLWCLNLFLFLIVILISLNSLFAQDNAQLENLGLNLEFLNEFEKQKLDFILKNHLQKISFSGPNCYNTVLRTDQVMHESELRHVGKDEFLLYFTLFYEERIGQPEFGDLVVYNNSSYKDHVAIYLGNDYVFHKKDVNKNHIPKIVKIDEVFKQEPFEMNPFNKSYYMGDEKKAVKDLGFYHLKQDVAEFSDLIYALSEQEIKQITLIEFFRQNILQYSKNWKIGHEMGQFTEDLFEEVKAEFYDLAQSENVFAQMAYAMFLSLRDQVFVSIEDAHYSSRYAQARAKEIRSQIYIHFNDYLAALITELFVYYNKHLDDDKAMFVYEYLLNLDTTKDHAQLFKLIANI
ncbi:MAG: NlpC/P60 family protein [Pseudomonadota bacterium]